MVGPESILKALMKVAACSAAVVKVSAAVIILLNAVEKLGHILALACTPMNVCVWIILLNAGEHMGPIWPLLDRCSWVVRAAPFDRAINALDRGRQQHGHKLNC